MESDQIDDEELERWGVIQQNKGRLQTLLDKLVEKLPGVDANIDDRVDLTHSKKRFWNINKEKYDITNEFNDYSELYKLVVHSLDPLSKRTTRARRIYLFYRNLTIAIFAVFLAFTHEIVVSLIESEASLSNDLPIALSIASVLLLLTLYLIAPVWNMSRSAEQEFVNELMVEFYEQEHDEYDEKANKSLNDYL